MWNEFLAPEAIPSVQVNARQTVAPARPVSIEEFDKEEWLHDFINGTEDALRSADGRDRSLEEWLAASFGEAILLGQDEEDETVTNVLNTACSSFIDQNPSCHRGTHLHPDSSMPLDEFESVAFGKPFPDRETEWYPYESKVVRHVT